MRTGRSPKSSRTSRSYTANTSLFWTGGTSMRAASFRCCPKRSARAPCAGRTRCLQGSHRLRGRRRRGSSRRAVRPRASAACFWGERKIFIQTKPRTISKNTADAPGRNARGPFCLLPCARKRRRCGAVCSIRLTRNASRPTACGCSRRRTGRTSSPL